MYLVLLTARESKDDMIFGLDAGADNYLVKPFDPEELRARAAERVRLVEIAAETERPVRRNFVDSHRHRRDRRVTRWNSAAQETFGPRSADVIGHPLMECGIEWTRPELVTRALQQPTPVRLDKFPFVDREGRRRLVDLTVTTMQRGPGDATGSCSSAPRPPSATSSRNSSARRRSSKASASSPPASPRNQHAAAVRR
jgi:CheY-like chemotaxis protein